MKSLRRLRRSRYSSKESTRNNKLCQQTLHLQALNQAEEDSSPPGTTYTGNPNAPFVYGSPDTGGISAVEAYGRQQGLGKTGKMDRDILQQMQSGDYSGIAGSYLAPIEEQGAANTSAALRSNELGANAMVRGQQPALYAGLDNQVRSQMAQGTGMALANAIPQLASQAGAGYQQALAQQEGVQMGALDAGLQGREAVMNAGHYSQSPSVLQDAMGIAQLGGQIGSDLTGFGSAYKGNPRRLLESQESFTEAGTIHVYEFSESTSSLFGRRSPRSCPSSLNGIHDLARGWPKESRPISLCAHSFRRFSTNSF